MIHAMKILRQSKDVAYLECRYSHNRMAYFILKLARSKVDAFKVAIGAGTSLDLDQYGSVLECGWGPLPRHYQEN